MKNVFSKKTILLLVGLFIVSYIVFSGFSQNDSVFPKNQREKTLEFSIGQRKIKAFVADTPELQEKGLGGRESISPDEVMLFFFKISARHGIWMKDMKFPIDIFWLDQSGYVIFLKENALPSSYPEVFTPDSLAQYVLEAHVGFARENNLKIGSEISFSKND
ncbi:MAG: DUF192 domain-containing protein [bacterium]|nr:DUF192 domain-containing protein [bacterium]